MNTFLMTIQMCLLVDSGICIGLTMLEVDRGPNGIQKSETAIKICGIFM